MASGAVRARFFLDDGSIVPHDLCATLLTVCCRAAMLRYSESKIRQCISGTKNDRILTPRVVFARRGEPDQRWFSGYMLDDRGVQGDISLSDFWALFDN